MSKKNYETKNLTKEKALTILLEAAKKRNLVRNKVAAFNNNSKFRSFFNYDQVQSIMNMTIAKCLQALIVYQKREAGETVPTGKGWIKIKQETQLDTLDNLLGYFVSAFRFECNKYWKEITAQKRENKELVSITAGSSFQSDSLDDLSIADFYLKEDSVDNYFIEKNSSKSIQSIYSSLKTDLYKDMFTALLDPELKGQHTKIKEHLDLSQYEYQKTRQGLIAILRKDHKEDLLNIQNKIILDDTMIPSGTQKLNQSAYLDSTVNVTSLFEENVLKNKKRKFVLKLMLIRKDKRHKMTQEIIKEKKLSKIGLPEEREQIRQYLTDKLSKFAHEYEVESQSIKSEGLKNLYANSAS
jgi:hypothetical protein